MRNLFQLLGNDGEHLALLETTKSVDVQEAVNEAFEMCDTESDDYFDDVLDYLDNTFGITRVFVEEVTTDKL